MKFSRKKILLVSSSIASILPVGIVISCSNSKANFNVSSDASMYSQIWNLSNFDIIKNSVFDMTISELENQINKSLKNNSENAFIMRIYSFYLLWKAIKSPNTDTGGTHTNLSNDIQSYSSFLSEKLKEDNESDIDKDKTFKNFKKYINTFDFNISILNFKNDSLNNDEKLRDVLANGEYVLNFKIDFWTTDKETNEKMISSSSGKSIMFKNSLTREQREIISKIKNEEIKQLTTRQYNYQSTKLYFDIESKKFSTIVLPSNINYNSIEDTPNSGYTSSDKQRKLFLFDWIGKSNSSTSFDTYLNIQLNDGGNFDTTMTSNFKLFLEKEGILKDSKMEKVKINLNKTIKYNAADYEE